MFPLAQVGAAPESLASQIVAIHARRPEADDHTRAIGDRRGVTIRIVIPALFRLAVLDVGLPKLLTVGSTQGIEAANASVRSSHREKNLVAPDNRRRVGGMVERYLPPDLFRGTPLQG